MKRLFVIWLVLCSWVSYPMLHAQIYTTSSSSFRSYSTSGMQALPTASFRTTSSYINHSPATASVHPLSHTAPMKVANGTIKTIASTIQSGILAEEQAYAPVSRIRGRQNTMAPPQYTQPLGDGWDVALLMAFGCIAYGLFLKRKNRKTQPTT